MKKAFLFALAVCCTFAAQAVTVGWTSHGTVEQGDSIAINGSATGFSVALVFDLTTVSSFSSMEAYLSVMSNTLCYSLGTDANLQHNPIRVGMNYSGNLPTTDNSSWKTNTDASVSKNGQNVVGLIFYTADGNQYIDCYVNGTLLNPGSKWTGSIPYNVTFNEIIIGNETNMSNIELYTMNGKATANDFASVPEPTALALLALGVAGLALKRKVA